MVDDSRELTEEEIDEIDRKAENEDLLFGDTDTTIDTADTEEPQISVSYDVVEEALLGMFILDDDIAMLVAKSTLRDIHFLKRTKLESITPFYKKHYGYSI